MKAIYLLCNQQSGVNLLMGLAFLVTYFLLCSIYQELMQFEGRCLSHHLASDAAVKPLVIKLQGCTTRFLLLVTKIPTSSNLPSHFQLMDHSKYNL